MPAISLAAALALATFQTPSFEADFDVALGTVGLSQKTACFDSGLLEFWDDTEFTTPFYSAANANPWRMPFFCETFRREIGGFTGLPSDILNSLLRMTGDGTRRTLLGSPIATIEPEAAKPGALEKVLADLQASGVVKATPPPLTGVPKEVQQAAALILGTAVSALPNRRLALRGIADVADAYLFASLRGRADLEGDDADKMLRLQRAIDVSYLGAAAHDVLFAAYRSDGADRGAADPKPKAAAQLVRGVSPQLKYDWEIDTTWGVIRLTGGSDTVHADRPTLLIIDTGGNDTYVNCPSNASAGNWLSVAIDTRGDDKYVSDPALATQSLTEFANRKNGGAKPGPGGALFGIAALYDMSGNDVYRAHRPAFGSGRFGVGVLEDEEGDDLYDGYADSEGFATMGAGLLEDQSGVDTYRCYSTSQGSSGVHGAGALIDRAGNDTYDANERTIDFPSPQSAEHNTSLSQGASIGRRADYLDGHSLAGGVGLLYDASGDDTYACGVFGQGVGYWQGIGMLWDGAGKDSYFGQWYVQGAAAHFAIGYLEDVAGNDAYVAKMNMAQGAGHDFSVGWLFDRDGDDTHEAPNLSLGAGNANGMGIFLDLLGTDTYVSSGVTLGKAAESGPTGLRSRALCLGVFMDMQGDDKYPDLTWAKNNTRTANWTQKQLRSEESQTGVFWDR